MVTPPEPNEEFYRRLAHLDEVRREGKTLSLVSPPMSGQAAKALAFLEMLDHVLAPQVQTANSTPKLHQLFDRFEILRPLGQGGFGTVYLAREKTTNRQVALKLPHLNLQLNDQLRQRFLREVQVAASLDHPGMVKLHEAGEKEGIFYLVSEFIDGPSLEAWLSEHPDPVPPTQAADLITALARAIQHTHTRGILHRDLKPANILLRPVHPPTPNSAELSAFVPLVTDFGLARFLEETNPLTRTGEIIGTFGYLSPEQVRDGATAVGFPADIWALGVIFYRLLTGKLLHEGKSLGEIITTLQRDKVAGLRIANLEVPRDLKAVCLKCLAYQPEDRYSSAEELADDLERWQRGEPTLAHPVGPIEAGLKWLRRSPGMAAGIVAGLLLTALIICGQWYQTRLLSQANEVAKQERQKAQRWAKELEQNLYLSDMRLVAQKHRVGDSSGLVDILDRHLPEHTDGRDHRGFEWYLFRKHSQSAKPTFTVHPEVWDTQLSYHQSGNYLLVQQPGYGITCLDARTGKVVSQLNVTSRSPVQTALAPSGRWAAMTRSADDTVGVFRLPEGKELARISSPLIGRMRFTLDEKSLLLIRADGVTRWEPETKKVTPLIAPWPELIHRVDGQALFVQQSIGEHLILPEDKNRLAIYNTATGRKVNQIALNHHTYFTRLRELPDGRIVGTVWNNLYVWDRQGRRVVSQFSPPNSPLEDLAVTRDGKLLATTDRLGNVVVWDTVTWQPRTLRRLNQYALAVTFTPDETALAVYTEDSQIHQVPLSESAFREEILAEDEVTLAEFAANSKYLAAGYQTGRIRVIRLTDKKVIECAGHRGEIKEIRFTPDGTRLVTVGSRKGEVCWWDSHTGNLIHQLQGPEDSKPGSCDIAPDGKSWVWFQENKVYVYATGSTTPDAVWPISPMKGQPLAVRFSPKGDRLALTDTRGRLWILQTPRQVKEQPREQWRADFPGPCSIDWQPRSPYRLGIHCRTQLYLCPANQNANSPVLQPKYRTSITHLGKGFHWCLDGRESMFFNGHKIASFDLQKGNGKLFLASDEFWGRESFKDGVFSPDGKWAWVQTKDGSFQLIDTTNWESSWPFGAPAGEIRSLVYQSNPERILTATRLPMIFSSVERPKNWPLFKRVEYTVYQPPGSFLREWSLNGAEHSLQLSAPLSFAPAQVIRLSSNQKWLAGACADASGWVWDTRTGKPAHRLYSTQPVETKLLGFERARKVAPARYHFDVSMLDIAFSSNGSQLALLDSKGEISLWETGTWIELARKKGYRTTQATTGWLSFTADGTSLAYGLNGRVELLDGRTLEERHRFAEDHEPFAECGIISPEDETLIYGRRDRQIYIYDLKSGEKRSLTTTHKQPVTALAFTPDGKTLATASREGTVHLYRSTKWQEVAVLDAPGPIHSLTFTPDGKGLVAATEGPKSKRGRVVIWRAK